MAPTVPGGSLTDHLNQIEGARSMAELAARTLAVLENFRLSAAASGVITGLRAATAERFHFARWPAGFLARYQSEQMQASDPIPRWALGAGTPATFTQILRGLPGKDPGLKVMRVASEFGCREGICVPIRSAGGAIGLFAMAGDREEFVPKEFRDLVAIATLAFRTAEGFDCTESKAQGMPLLTVRETEMLPFLVHGHSDQEIAQLSGISQATVRFHLKNVRQKIGAISRTHLAAKAVALGFVSM
jgi:LuxR family quorum sensing-dependent transcriptional regulator